MIKFPICDRWFVACFGQRVSLWFKAWMRTSLILAKLGLASFNCVAFCNLAPFQGQDLDASKYMALVVLVKSGASLLAKPCCNKPRSAKSQIWWCSTIGILVYLVQCSRSGCVLVYLVHALVQCCVVLVLSQRNGCCSAEPSFTGHGPLHCISLCSHVWWRQRQGQRQRQREGQRHYYLSPLNISVQQSSLLNVRAR